MNTMNSKRKTDILMKSIECINKADIEGINALLTEDHIFIDLNGVKYPKLNYKELKITL
jgi:hypothetical protein